MFSPFGKEVRPELLTRVESLHKPPYFVLDDSWQDNFPSLRSFLNKGKESKISGKFHFYMNISHFKPREVNVTTADGFIVVEAKHADNPSAQDAESPNFKKEFKLPDDIDLASVNFTFAENGLLVVKANKIIPAGNVIPSVIACKPEMNKSDKPL